MMKRENSLVFIDEVMKIKNREECLEFFSELLTEKELDVFAQRIEIAKLVDLGESYENISEKTGASAATVSRVKRAVNDKKTGSTLIKVINNEK